MSWFTTSGKIQEKNTKESPSHRSPCCSIFPKYLLWLVQFHRRYLNWYWHSLTPSLAPLATSLTISGWLWHSSACFPARRFAFLQMVLGSITSGLPTALEKVEMGRQREDRTNPSGERWEKVGCFCLLSHTCSFHHSVNSVAEVISSHKPEAFLCCWRACQPCPQSSAVMTMCFFFC